jgi:hypothetical protein
MPQDHTRARTVTFDGHQHLVSASRGQFVFVDNAAQDVASSHAQHAGTRCGGSCTVRRSQVDPAVRSLRVVVGDVFPEHPLEMTPTEDERPVKALTSYGADPSLGEGVCSRSADRGEDGLDAVRGEDRVEAPRVLGVSVPDQVANRPRPRRSHERFRAVCVTQPESGCAVTPARWTRRVRSSMTKQTYSVRSQVVCTV